jgi:hypothetical protein
VTSPGRARTARTAKTERTAKIAKIAKEAEEAEDAEDAEQSTFARWQAETRWAMPLGTPGEIRFPRPLVESLWTLGRSFAWLLPARARW